MSNEIFVNGSDIHDVCIDTSQLLSDFYGSEDSDLWDAFAEWREESEDCTYHSSHFEDVVGFMESQGFELAARDNVYNGENDLSDVYVWEVWQRDASTDWLYPSGDTVVVVFEHRGGDVRGNYGAPSFYRPNGTEYTIPVDLCVEWHVEAAGPSGRMLEAEALAEKLNDSCELLAGCSSYPTGQLEDAGFDVDWRSECGRWLDDDDHPRYLTRHSSGVWCYLIPGRPYMG